MAVTCLDNASYQTVTGIMTTRTDMKYISTNIYLSSSYTYIYTTYYLCARNVIYMYLGTSIPRYVYNVMDRPGILKGIPYYDCMI